jgi:hypothetical protein
MSDTTHGRSSALALAARASRSSTGRLPKRQSLFATTKPFPFTADFSIHPKRSTAFFPFDTNEPAGITPDLSAISDIVARSGKIACATKGSL